MNNELTAALLTIEKCRELSGCPAGVALQDWVKQLAAERDAALNAERVWETAMMEVCGEDGPASVAAVINALAVENVALKSGASYFSYGSEHNFEWHKTAEEAVEAAEAAIDDYRGDACDGWSEEVDSICWGVIMQSSAKVGERPRNEDDRCDPAIDTVCDYALLPNIETPATDRIVAGIKADGSAEGINFAASRLAAAFNHGHVDKPMTEVGDVVRMILTAKEDLANDPVLPEDGLSGEYAEKSLAEWEAELREGADK